MSKKISDILPKTEILAQLAEEASELAQAALELLRALDGTNPTPKSVNECENRGVCGCDCLHLSTELLT